MQNFGAAPKYGSTIIGIVTAGAVFVQVPTQCTAHAKTPATKSGIGAAGTLRIPRRKIVLGWFMGASNRGRLGFFGLWSTFPCAISQSPERQIVSRMDVLLHVGLFLDTPGLPHPADLTCPSSSSTRALLVPTACVRSHCTGHAGGLRSRQREGADCPRLLRSVQAVSVSCVGIRMAASLQPGKRRMCVRHQLIDVDKPQFRWTSAPAYRC